MSKKITNRRYQRKQKIKKEKRNKYIIPAVITVCIALVIVLMVKIKPDNNYEIVFKEKISLLEEQVLTEEMEKQAEKTNKDAGYVVFISICDTKERARVFTGTGKTLEKAWEDSVKNANKAVLKMEMEPVWVKADIVVESERKDYDCLCKEIYQSRHEFYRYGVSFDEGFKTALLESEMNGAKIYEYDDGGVDLKYLNSYLKKSNRNELDELPNEMIVFRTKGWLCDEERKIYSLIDEGLDYGRRNIELIDKEYAEEIILNASRFLVNQVKEDGSFIYGIYPRFDNDIDNYNVVRHASTIWSLICRYSISPDEELKETLDSTIEYLLTQVVYKDENTAYLYEEKDDEIKLGGCGVAVIALTEYMNVMGTDKYLDVCEKLGNGILTMLDEETGKYYHVLDGSYNRKAEFRTVYYDGEATFALCRLYGASGDQKWLDAAQSAVDHFIEADYSQYKDHWVAYSMNEITKYVKDDKYYDFALMNAQVNLKSIYDRDTTYHTYLELLMSAFELYDRMVTEGIETDYMSQFDVKMFLKTIYCRVNRQLDGYFYPEYAMYMKNPGRILNTFMVRHDGYRVRIDDVQHNIGGYYKYYQHYDKLVEYGMLEAADDIISK